MSWLHSVLRQSLPRRFTRSERLRKRILREAHGHVMTGPFAGMQVGERAFGSMHLPKLLGTYEKEISEAVEWQIARGVDRVVVMGAAEGYYAIGLALRLPAASVIAFEASPGARVELSRLAVLNGAEGRVEVCGICDAKSVSDAVGAGRQVLVICDIEGAEAVIIDPNVVPGLRAAAMIVETHDSFVPGVRDLIINRFAHSHSITLVQQRPRCPEDARHLLVSPAYRGALTQMLSERRPPGNDWLILIPRSLDGTPGS